MFPDEDALALASLQGVQAPAQSANLFEQLQHQRSTFQVDVQISLQMYDSGRTAKTASRETPAGRVVSNRFEYTVFDHLGDCIGVNTA